MRSSLVNWLIMPSVPREASAVGCHLSGEPLQAGKERVSFGPAAGPKGEGSSSIVCEGNTTVNLINRASSVAGHARVVWSRSLSLRPVLLERGDFQLAE